MISDGQANGESDVMEATDRVFATRVGSRSLRVFIRINAGDDCETKIMLQRFGKYGYVCRDGANGEEIIIK